MEISIIGLADADREAVSRERGKLVGGVLPVLAAAAINDAASPYSIHTA